RPQTNFQRLKGCFRQGCVDCTVKISFRKAREAAKIKPSRARNKHQAADRIHRVLPPRSGLEAGPIHYRPCSVNETCPGMLFRTEITRHRNFFVRKTDDVNEKGLVRRSS